jgi:hypothetical protein
MASIKKALAGILKTKRKRARTKKKKEKKYPVKILALTKQSDVPKILKLSKLSPMILLYIKDYRKKNNKSLKKSLQKLRKGGEPDGIKSKLLDPNWVVVLAPNTN